MVSPSKFSRLKSFGLAGLFAAAGIVIITYAGAATLATDINKDGRVDILDLSLLLSRWSTADPSADLDASGVVDVLDLSRLLADWGMTSQTPSPSASATPAPTASTAPTPSGTPTFTPMPPISSRDNLIYGDYEPSSATTGVVPGTVLAPHNPGCGDLIISTSGTILKNFDICGDIKVRAANVQIINSRLRGGHAIPAGATAVVDCNDAACQNLTVEDSTILPDRPSYYRDGILGHSYHSLRNDISHTNDGLGIYNKPGGSIQVNATAKGNYIHDLTEWNPDPAHTDGTHNDGIQMQGGRNVLMLGNKIVDSCVLGDDRKWGGALSSPSSAKPDQFTQPNGPHCNGGGVIIQDNTGGGLDATVIFTKNWLRQGGTGGNLKDGVYEYSHNHLYRGSFYLYTSSSTSSYPIRPTSPATAAKVIGLFGTNTYTDNGEVLSIANGGIRY